MTVLTAAVKTCMLMADKPVPSVARSDLLGDGVAYDISFSIPSIEVYVDARSELLGHVQNHLRHAGIALAVAGVPAIEGVEVPTTATLLQESDWFGILASEDRDLLSEYLEEIWFATGDHLIKQGDDPQALFIIASGTVEITDTSMGEKLIFRLGPGGSLGAVGMITGAPYGATATALTPVTAYRLDRVAVSKAITRKPELVQSLEILAKRGLEMQRSDVVAHPNDHINEPELFLSKLRSFLRKMADRPRH
jgi:CRP-like cAMP-binding protein